MAERLAIRALNAALSEANLPPDRGLLELYATTNDHAAFELLVRRHADLVWRVCRGVLSHDRHAAEDAFQATFLVLARRAGSVRSNLPGWLFRVARRIAIRAMSNTKFAATVELDRLEFTAEVEAASDLAPILLEEIERLAAKFRDPVLLCFYEGHTHAEAAAKLGWPIGTLASRLARAKATLRGRLARRGVALSIAGLTGALSSPIATLGSDVLQGSIVAVLGPPTAVSTSVVSLSKGALTAMRIAQMKWLGLASAVFLGIAGAGIAIGIGQDAPPANAVTPKIEAALNEQSKTAFPEIKPTDADRLPAVRPVAGATDSDLRRLQIARFQLALAEYEFDLANVRANAGDPPDARVLVSAARDVIPSDEVVTWLSWNVAVAKRREQNAAKLFEGNGGMRRSVQVATRERVEAEIELLRFKQVRALVRDPKMIELTVQRIAKYEETLQLNMKLFESGSYDVNNLYIHFVLQRDLLHSIVAAFGESRESMDKLEAVHGQAKAVHAMLKKRWDAGTIRRQDVATSEAHVLYIAGEIESLKAKVGAAPLK